MTRQGRRRRAGARPIGSIEDQGRTLVERLGGRWTKHGGLCRCPAHDDRSPSLSVRPGQTRLLLHCFAGCSATDILAALAAGGLLVRGAPAEEPQAHGASEPCPSAAAERIWAASRAVEGTPAASYLERRGIRLLSAQLRFNARTPSGASPLTRYRPALVAAVRDESGLTGILRTFLDCAGRGAGSQERRAGLGHFGRGAVRLGPSGPRLGLAEGVETALSASQLFGLPCWATLGTERFRLVAIPRDVEELHLFLDHDEGGRRAEMLARQSFAQLEIQVHVPRRPGDDWNDVLCAALGGG